MMSSPAAAVDGLLPIAVGGLLPIAVGGLLPPAPPSVLGAGLGVILGGNPSGGGANPAGCGVALMGGGAVEAMGGLVTGGADAGGVGAATRRGGPAGLGGSGAAAPAFLLTQRLSSESYTNELSSPSFALMGPCCCSDGSLRPNHPPNHPFLAPPASASAVR
jgi:hypothetical protein